MPDTTQEEGVRKVAELIKDVRICMLTTLDSDGHLHSRPMANQEVEFDGDLWFFTSGSSGKVFETRRDARVNVSFADPKAQNYVSVSGTASLSHDRGRMEDLWSPAFTAWFPDGLDDPDLALLHVHAESAEYWNSPSGLVVHALGMVKAAVTGKPASGREHEKVNLTDS